ncbi:glycosyltransferase family 4 protein [Larkinella soli]|uniref:glycosyltransferase family 4 protein n=1 Tax=Larkinella soli TaxID=1770527 RepID=UPI000FFBEA8A|nr:glycosyltransferase family 4 protein [Larkinella soli]
MRVLMVSFLIETDPSGVVTYYRNTARDLKNKGVGVEVISSGSMPRFWRYFLGILRRIMLRIGRVPTFLYYEFAHFTSIYLAVRRARRETFDLIHAQDVVTGVAAFLALKKSIPVVLTCHFNDNPVTERKESFGLNGHLLKQTENWYRYLFSFVKHYVFVSNYVFEKSCHLFPSDCKKIIIHNTINLKRIHPKIAPLSPDHLIISNVGYVEERKNQKLLIQIGKELSRRGIQNFTIWIIGDGPKREEYEALTAASHLTDRVKFLGRQVDPWQLVARSHLYVHTALNDNCPYALLEAMAVKTPVLALPVGGIPEILPRDYGWLLSETVPALTDQIQKYFDEKERRKLVTAQTDFIRGHLDHQVAVRKLIDFYHETIHFQ